MSAATPSSARTSPPTKQGGQVLSTAELFEAIRRQDPDWKERAFDAYYGLVQGLLYRALGPLADIDDLLNEVFLRFFQNAHRVRVPHKLRSYLVTIVMNVVRLELSQRKRRRVIGFILDRADELEQVPSGHDANAKAALLRLTRVVEGLSTEDRLVYVLSTLEGLPTEEVAEALGISFSTARRRIKRAVTHVRNRVARDALLADYVEEWARGNR